jgi:hypothetical protein
MFLAKGFAVGKNFDFEGFKCRVTEDGSPMLLRFDKTEEEYWVMGDNSVQKGDGEGGLPEFHADNALPSHELVRLHLEVKFLLARYSSCHVRSQVMSASGKGEKEVVMELFSKAKLNREEKNIVFIHAAQHGQSDLLEFLLLNGVEINAKNSIQRSALHIACLKGDEKMAEFLLSRQALFNDGDENKESPLHLAVRMNRKKICEILCDHGADIDAENKFGESSLSLSDRLKHLEINELLRHKKIHITLPGIHTAVTLGGVELSADEEKPEPTLPNTSPAAASASAVSPRGTKRAASGLN